MSLPIKIEFRLERDNALLMLIVDKDSIDLEAKVKEAEYFGLLKKTEFHITIIGSETGEVILNVLDELDGIQKIETKNKLREACESFFWQAFLLDEYYYVRKHYNKDSAINFNEPENEVRESIIQLVKIPRLSNFYERINSLFNQQFETPFPHVTLYTNSTRAEKKMRGIGIYSKKHFKSLETKKI